MKHDKRISLIILGWLLALPVRAAVLPAQLDSYNVVWDWPSVDSLDSMPLSGRHGAGVNVWVQDGSIRLYLA